MAFNLYNITISFKIDAVLLSSLNTLYDNTLTLHATHERGRLT